jgi:P4 family phage/plasmid primase-like protien
MSIENVSGKQTVGEIYKNIQPVPSGASSKDFEKLGRDGLLELFGKYGTGIFYHIVEKDEKLISVFQPALLSAFFRIVYNVETIKPMRIGYPGDMLYYDYNKAFYRPNAETQFTKLIKDWWNDGYLRINKTGVFDDLRASTYVDRSELSLDSKYIPVPNGMLELEQKNGIWTIKLIGNSPKFFVHEGERIATQYDPSAKCPRFLKFLSMSLPNQQKEQIWIQEYMGYCLYRIWIFDKVMLWTGEGDNGKTTLMNIILALLGEENTTNNSLQDLCSGRWYLAGLEHKLANLKDDLSDEDLKYTGRFKEITGGKRQVQAERKFKDPFNLTPITKHIYAGNQIPYSPDSTEAFWRRWFIVNWTKQFIVGDPERDELLEENIIAEELPGILNWALEGLIRILTNMGFTNMPKWEETKAQWEAMSNPVAAFIYDPEHVAWVYDAHYRIDEFNPDLGKYCTEKKLPHWNPIRVGRMVAKLYKGEITKKYIWIGDESRQVHCYTGICAKRNAPKHQSDMADSLVEERKERKAGV